MEFRAIEIRTGRVRFDQVGSHQICIAEIRSCEIASEQVGKSKFCTLQVSARKLRHAQVCPRQISAGKRGMACGSPEALKVRAPQGCSCQICSFGERSFHKFFDGFDAVILKQHFPSSGLDFHLTEFYPYLLQNAKAVIQCSSL